MSDNEQIGVRVLYFAHFSDLAGRKEEQVLLPSGASVASLASLLGSRDRRLSDLIGYGRAAVNSEWAAPETVLRDGDEVAFMPPMSGG